MSDSDDYLTMDIVATTTSPKKTYSDQRKILLATVKQRQQQPSLQIREEHARKRGLETAISSENKGFKLLEKMGFKYSLFY